MGLKFFFGDLLSLRDVDAIVHQVNCLCIKSHGLSKQLAEKYPWGDIYSKRLAEGNRNLTISEDRDTPGSIRTFKPQEFLYPDIVCFFSQWDFGLPEHNLRHIPPYHDTRKNRETWFQQCLEALQDTSYKSIAFPYQIGCGLGGGDWNSYIKLIEEFAHKSNTDVYIVRPSFAWGK